MMSDSHNNNHRGQMVPTSVLPGGTWSMLPAHIRDSGSLGAMRSAVDFRVFIAMVLRADWTNDSGVVRYDRMGIAVDAGLIDAEQLEGDEHAKARSVAIRMVRRSQSNLIAKGLIEVARRGGGRNICTTYRIVSHSQTGTGRTPVSLSKQGQHSPTFQIETGTQEVLKQGHRPAPNTDTGALKGGQSVPTSSERTESSEQQKGAAAAGVVVYELQKLGVGQPTLDELAGLASRLDSPDALAMIRRVDEERRKRGMGIGVLVQNLRSVLPARAAEVAAQAEHRARAEQQRRERERAAEAEQQRLEEERQEREAMWEKMTSDEQEHLRNQLLTKLKPIQRKMIERGFLRGPSLIPLAREVGLLGEHAA